MIISAGPNFARTGVVAGFTMSIDTNQVSLTKGVLFAQTTMYRPSSAPGSAITQPATTGMNWLFYNTTSGFYWQTSTTPANSGDAFLGWALRDSSGNVLAVSRQLVTVPDEDGTGAPVVIPLGSVLGAEDELPPTPATNTSTIETDTIGGIPSYRFHVAISSGGGTTSGCVAQVRFYSDSGATTPLSDWIDIGWLPVTATTLDSDWWPLSDTQEYAKIRVAAQNSGNALSAWLESSIITKPASTGLGIWVADPVIPTACSITVLENGDNFGLRTAWTPATSYGGTVGYEREIRYYSDSGATTPISDWVPLGAIYGPTTATADSGFWPKPASVQYVRLRVRAYAPDGAVTNWLNSSTPLPSIAISALNVQAAVAPTSPTITVLTQDGNFGLRTAWTEAGSVGGTVGYDREVRYYSDNGAGTALSDWIALGSVGVGTATADSGWWPKPSAAEYIRFRVRAYNGLGAPTSWVYSSTPIPAIPIAASALLDPVAPTSPTITVLTQDGNFGLRTAWTEAGSLGGTVGYDREVRYYSDSGASTPISDWIPLGAVRAGVATADSGWWPNPSTIQYVRFRVRAYNGLGTPTSWVYSATPLPSVSTLAVPPVVAGNGSTVQTATLGGVPSYRFHVSITEATNKGSTSQYVAQARFYSDSGGSTPTSEWITLGSFPVGTTVMDTDYWASPTAAVYAKIRVAGQNAENALGTWLESSILTVTASSGLKATSLDASTIAAPLYKDVSNNLSIQISNDFVVSGGKLTQNLVDLAKANNFDTSQFTKSGGVLIINALAVNKLVAGDALFAGQVTFAYAGGGKVTINSSGLTLADSNTSPSATVTISSSGINLVRGTSSVSITASSVAITNGILSSPNITVSGSAFTVTINTTDGVKVANSSNNSYVMLADGRLAVQGTGVSVDYSSYFGCSSFNLQRGSYYGRLYGEVTSSGVSIQLWDTNGSSYMQVYAGSTHYISSSKSNSYISFSGSGSYAAFGAYKVSSTTVIDSSLVADFASIKIGGTETINSSRQFVGAGVACTGGGIGGTGFNVYQSGWYYGVTGPSTFTTSDGKTVTVRGGIIVSIA